MTTGDPEESLAGLGEFAVIDRLISGRDQPAAVVLGPGDDAAVVRAADGRIVVSTDMLIEGRHFRLDWSTPQMSDARPSPRTRPTSRRWERSRRRSSSRSGRRATRPPPTSWRCPTACGRRPGVIGAGIVGGDLVSAPQWVISVTALGDLGGREPVKLRGARPGDTVALVGELGWSAAGLALWHNGINGFDEMRQRHLVPRVPYGEGRVAADAGATAMTDVSDGLLADLGHIADASGVGVDVSRDGLSVDHEALRGVAAATSADAWAWVFGGGEDHALVATFPGPLPAGWRRIGAVVDGPSRVLVDGEPWHGNPGWQSF